MRRPTPLPTVLLALATLALAACGQQQRNRESSALPELREADAEGLMARVRGAGADVVLVNVWASWCQPCREEMPDLLRLRRALRGRGLELILVSADFDDQRERARAFLAGLGVDFPTLIKTGGDADFIEALNPAWSGSLPATLMFSGSGERIGFWEGRATYEQLRAAVEPHLERSAAGGAGTEGEGR